VARGETAEEVLLLILEHIKTFHGLYEIPHTVTDGFRKFIREEALT
jgi:predicted small metal-binding protein